MPCSLNSIELQALELFRELTRLLGMPRSIGEIYGLLYIRPNPLHLDELSQLLGISKGSTSQGLKFLRQVGAIHEVNIEGQRRTHYSAATELKRLIAGFIAQEVRPQLQATEQQLLILQERIFDDSSEENRDFYSARLDKLHRWVGRAKFLLPIIQRVMGA